MPLGPSPPDRGPNSRHEDRITRWTLRRRHRSGGAGMISHCRTLACGSRQKTAAASRLTTHRYPGLANAGSDKSRRTPVAPCSRDRIGVQYSRHLNVMFPRKSIAPSQSPNWLNTNKGAGDSTCSQSDRCTTLPPVLRVPDSPNCPCGQITRRCGVRDIAPSTHLAFTRPNPSTIAVLNHLAVQRLPASSDRRPDRLPSEKKGVGGGDPVPDPFAGVWATRTCTHTICLYE